MANADNEAVLLGLWEPSSLFLVMVVCRKGESVERGQHAARCISNCSGLSPWTATGKGVGVGERSCSGR